MEDAPNGSSFERRLELQNEVLKLLEDISEKMQKRANDVTVEMHGLLDQTGVVEQDLRNTFNSFSSLSNLQFIENRISEEDEKAIGEREGMDKSAKADIPAQNYEVDILPRYKEALSLGLSSCRHHFQKTNRKSSMGSTHGQLPYIIGTEEYMHDNSCGLTEDLISEWEPLNFSHVAKQTEMQSDAAMSCSPAMLNANLFGIEHNTSENDGIEPLVSAALDFKAMLEAALLSPYKFYDEESSSLATVERDYSVNFKEPHAELDHGTSKASNIIEGASSKQLTSIDIRNLSIPTGDLTDELRSALISGSLFDAEEPTFPSSQNQPVDHLQPENTDGNNLSGISANPTSPILAGHAVCSVKSDVVHAGDDAVTVLVNNGPSCEGAINVGDGFEQNFGTPVCNSSPCSTKIETTFSPLDDSDSKGKVLEGFLTAPLKGLFDEFDVDDANGISKSISGTGHQEQIIVIASDTENTTIINETSSSDIAHRFLSKQRTGNEMTKVAGGLIGKVEPHSSASSSYSGNSSIATYMQQRERSFLLDITKPIINDVPCQEKPIFSTVVSVSPATLSSNIDMDTWSSSSNEDNSGSSSLQEKPIAEEICNTEVQPELCDAVSSECGLKFAKSEIFSVRFGDASESENLLFKSLDMYPEYSTTEDGFDEETSLNAEQNPKIQKCSVVNRMGSLPSDPLAAEEVQNITVTHITERGDQAVVSSSIISSPNVEDSKVDSTNRLLPLGGERRSEIASLLKLPVRRPSLFDSDDEN